MATGRTLSPSTSSASSGSSSASAARAPCAWPIAFISCQWPSSMIVTSAASSHQNSRSSSVEARRHRRPVGDGDGHRDQEHHPRLPGTNLGDPSDQERPPAPPEDDRAEHGSEPARSRRSRTRSRTSPSLTRWSRRAAGSGAGSARSGAGTSRGRARRACRARHARREARRARGGQQPAVVRGCRAWSCAAYPQRV